MMRASVLIIVTAAASAACRLNPGFMLSGGDEDDEETGATDDTGDDTEDETDAAVCAPVPDHEVADVCQEYPAPAIPPNLAISGLFAMEPCGTTSDLVVKRTDDVLHVCDADCGDCPMDRAVSIGLATAYKQYDALLPRDGQCARLWHRSGNIANTGEQCNSTAYAVFDIDDAARLRFAVSYGEVDPFADITDLDLAVTASQPAPCVDNSFQDACDVDDQVLTFTMNFRFGACELPATTHKTSWTGIVVDDTRYALDVLAAFQCYPGESVFTWFLRRA